MKSKLPLAVAALLSVLALAAVPLAYTGEAYAATSAEITYDITYSTGDGTFQSYTESDPDIEVTSGNNLRINITVKSQASGERTIYFEQSQFNERISGVVIVDSDEPISILPSDRSYTFTAVITSDPDTHGSGEVTLRMVVGDPATDTSQTVEIPIGVDVRSAIYSEGYYNKIMGIYGNPLGEPLDQPI
ncbi:MAG: hypothetical protein PHV81_04830 [Candidatus Methanomethylophilaceae archaeon]|nr:hypothetical protein [Candidatus Methanomethylophilaceae archaeon]